MKRDARDFLLAVRRHTAKVSVGGVVVASGTVLDLINAPDTDIPHRRAWFLLEKWVDKGWYEYGVCVDLGWLTAKGEELADRVARTRERGFGWVQNDSLVFCWTTTGLCGEFKYWRDDNGHHLQSCSLAMRNGGDVHDIAGEHELVIFEQSVSLQSDLLARRLAKIELRSRQYSERMHKYNRGVWSWNDRTYQRGTT